MAPILNYSVPKIDHQDLSISVTIKPVPFTQPIGPLSYQFRAIWDTGATICAVGLNVINRLKLKPIRIVGANTGGGEFQVGLYVIDLEFASGFKYPSLVVNGLNTNQVDFLIGMDIIGKGDFAITTSGKDVQVAFRTPAKPPVITF